MKLRTLRTFDEIEAFYRGLYICAHLEQVRFRAVDHRF